MILLGNLTSVRLAIPLKTESLIVVKLAAVIVLKSTVLAAVPAKALASILVIPLGNVIAFSLPSLALGALASAVPNFTVANFVLPANASLGIPVKLAGKVTVVKFGMLLKVPHWASFLLGQLLLLSVFPPVTIFVLLKSILVNPLPSKAPGKSPFPALILLTVLGISIDINFTVPAKLAAEIVVKPFGSLTSFKLTAFWKALLPKALVSPLIFVSLKSMLSNPVPWKALVPILVNVLANLLPVVLDPGAAGVSLGAGASCVKVFRAVVPWKALSPIEFTVLGNLTVVNFVAPLKVEVLIV